MKEIIVSNQPSLSFARVLRITADGIRYRLFRAAITVAVIGVAVAFLLNILSESLIKRAVALDTRDRMAESRQVYRWTAHLSVSGTVESILRDAADPAGGPAAIEDFTRMGRLDANAAGQLRTLSVPAVRYLDFFSHLDYARRRRLVHQAEGTGIFDRLRVDSAFAAFAATLKQTRSVRLPGTVDEFQAFLNQWPGLREQVARVQNGQEAAINKLTAALNGRDLTEALADADGDFGRIIAEAGFVMEESEARDVSRQVRLLLDSRIIEKSLEYSKTRQVIARRHDIVPADVTLQMMWRFLGDREQAAAYLTALREANPEYTTLSAERLTELSGHWREMNRLEQVFLLTADMGDGWLGLGRRMSWLLFVSMLVCAIGISNAMLMTVTERFREIATLKCLGALDNFILVMFVLESCIMGIVGGLAGGLLGILLGSGRMLAAFGVSFIRSIPLSDLLVSMGIALLVGVFLAAVAAVYPALKAARLAPMEAMRVE